MWFLPNRHKNIVAYLLESHGLRDSTVARVSKQLSQEHFVVGETGHFPRRAEEVDGQISSPADPHYHPLWSNCFARAIVCRAPCPGQGVTGRAYGR